MKKIFIPFLVSIFISIHGNAQNFLYDLEWCSYMPSIGSSGNARAKVSSNGFFHLPFHKTNTGANFSMFDFDSWLTSNANLNTPLITSNQSFHLVLDANQNLVYGSYLGTIHGNIEVSDSNESNYWAGTTFDSIGISTTGAHQEVFSNHSHNDTLSLPDGSFIINEILDSDGFIVKFNPDGTKAWGTYLNGNQGMTQITAKKLVNNILYFSGRTSAITGLTTSNASLPTPLLDSFGYDSFLGAITDQGTLLWLTYTHQKIGIGSNLQIDALGNIYLRNALNKNINKFNNQGVWLSELTIPIDVYLSNLNFYVSNDNKIYIFGSTNQSENIGTLGSFRPSKIAENENFVVCYDSNFNKLWGTYLGEGESSFLLTTAAFDANNNFTVGFTTSTPNLAQIDSFQSTINGSNDFVIMNLNTLGQLNWSTYFGGNSTEPTLSGIHFDRFNNMYLEGRTTSTSNFITPNAFFPVIYPENNYSNPFIAKFTFTPTASTETFDNHLNVKIYPNPTSDILHIETNEDLARYEMYNSIGQIVKKDKLILNSINLNHLPVGTYLLNLFTKKNKKITLKVVKN